MASETPPQTVCSCDTYSHNAECAIHPETSPEVEMPWVRQRFIEGVPACLSYGIAGRTLLGRLHVYAELTASHFPVSVGRATPRARRVPA